jgi:eukaryotic translation initiation factor 2C
MVGDLEVEMSDHNAVEAQKQLEPDPGGAATAEGNEDASLAVQLNAVKRNGRYGTLGKELTLDVNSFAARLKPGAPKMICQWNLKFYSRQSEPQQGGGGRGRGRKRSRDSEGDGRNRMGPHPRATWKENERSPPLKIALELIRRIENNQGCRSADPDGRHFPHNCRLAYDGRKLVYSSVKPSFRRVNYEVTQNVNGKDVSRRVEFIRTADVDIGRLQAYINKEPNIPDELPTDAVNCLNVILRTRPLQDHVWIGRSFYIKNTAQDSQGRNLGLGCEAWRGYYQALKVVDSGLSLSFDTTYTAFYKVRPATGPGTSETLLGLAVELLGARNDRFRQAMAGPGEDRSLILDVRELRILRNEIRGLRCVRAASLAAGNASSEYFIEDLSELPANEQYFEKDGTRITVGAYCDQRYGRLKFSSFPCVQIPGTRRGHRPIFLPLEHVQLCDGQRRTKRMPNEMKDKLCDIASRAPRVRRNDIAQMFEHAKYEVDQYMKAFGVEISSRTMTRVKGRLLDPPRLRFRKNELQLQADGPDMCWTVGHPEETTDKSDPENQLLQLYRTDKRGLKAWGVLMLAPELHRRDVEKFVTLLMQASEEAGLEVAFPRYSAGNWKTLFEDMTNLRNLVETDLKTSCQIILVVKVDQDTEDYNRIKLIGETMLGIPTQCVVQRTIEEPHRRHCQNMVLKMNAKMGGINFRLVPEAMPDTFRDETWMIIGVDVTHAPRDDDGDSASVIACVGTMDRFYASHRGNIRLSLPSEFAITALGTMVTRLLRQFQKKNGFLPRNLLVYRDGVPEGMYQSVITAEVMGILDECFKIEYTAKNEKHYRPNITFVTMQKGHHTRFFPSNLVDADETGNCRAGTVIDSCITSVCDYDFYLYSHNGGKRLDSLEMTTRPVRYTVLWDDNDMSPDTLQRVTYDMCFTFARASRPVSVVPVTYYARLLAARQRAYLSAKARAKNYIQATLTLNPNDVPSNFSTIARIAKARNSTRLFPTMIPSAETGLFFI